MIQIQFETQADDFLAFQRFVASSLQGRNKAGRWWILVCVCTGVVLGATGFTESLHWPTAVALAAFFIVVWGWARWQLTRASVPSEGGAILCRRQITLDDIGVRDKSTNHDAVTTWRGVLAIEETPTHVFLMIDRFAAYIVPKRAFQDAAQLGGFLTFAKQHVAA
jgi:hypothetical protein